MDEVLLTCPGPLSTGTEHSMHQAGGSGHCNPEQPRHCSLQIHLLGCFLWVCGEKGRWVMAGDDPGLGNKRGSSTLSRQWRLGSTQGGWWVRSQQLKGAAPRESDGEGISTQGR